MRERERFLFIFCSSLMMRLLLAVVAAIAMVHAFDLAPVPHGSYCFDIGLNNTLNNLKVDISPFLGTFNISASVFGTPLTCPLEAYSYNTSTMVITLTNFNDPSDCLALQLGKYGIGEPNITYDSMDNSLVVDVVLVNITLIAC